MKPRMLQVLAFVVVGGVCATVVGTFLSFVSGAGDRARENMRYAMDRDDPLVVISSDLVDEQARCSLTMAYAEDNRHCSATLSCEGRTLYDGTGDCAPFPRRDASVGVLYDDGDVATGGGRLAVTYAYDFRVALRTPDGHAVLTALDEYEGEVTAVDAEGGTFVLAEGRRVAVTDETAFADGDAASLEEIASLLGGKGRVRVVVGAIYELHRGQRMHRARTLRVKRLD